MSRIQRVELERVASTYGFSKIEDLHAALGYGRYSARQVLHNLAPDQVPEKEAAAPPVDGAKLAADPLVAPRGGKEGDLVIRVKGIDDLLVYRAKCCNPIRGESIVGYVTRGKGVAVHSTNCANVQNLMYEVERKIDVEWARAASENFPVRMVIYTDDRPGMLNQLTSVLFQENSNIRSLEARSDDKRGGDGAIVEMTVEVKDKRQLEKVTGSMRRIAGVRDIERVQ
jgi:GTP diphosphokinase / guanosine-3',5'-bis(diphosphate) 3'-diphosphatase